MPKKSKESDLENAKLTWPNMCNKVLSSRPSPGKGRVLNNQKKCDLLQIVKEPRDAGRHASFLLGETMVGSEVAGLIHAGKA